MLWSVSTPQNIVLDDVSPYASAQIPEIMLPGQIPVSPIEGGTAANNTANSVPYSTKETNSAVSHSIDYLMNIADNINCAEKGMYRTFPFNISSVLKKNYHYKL